MAKAIAKTISPRKAAPAKRPPKTITVGRHEHDTGDVPETSSAFSFVKRRGAKEPLPAGVEYGRPIVAVVGRPNIGKSTLFNRLAGARLAIVEDIPGVTRDRHYADCLINGHEVVIIDTGGFDPDSDDPMQEGIASQVALAVQEADVVLCLFDALTEPMPADRAAVELLRRSKKPVVYAANKADSTKLAAYVMAYYELGIDDVVAVSALHGLGLPELEARLAKLLPKAKPMPVYPDAVARVAIVGRPNAGKSSIINRLLGEDRQLVDARPGTTVDSIDTLFIRNERSYVLIDTAGVRRKRGVEETVESLAVMKSIRAMERASVVVIMIDANLGVAEQDAKLLGLAIDRGRAIVIALNKSDLMESEEVRRKAMIRAREILSFAPWARMVMLSAKTGRATNKLLDEVDRALKGHQQRVTTSQLNKFFEEVLEYHPPPTAKGRAIRLYYVTQAETKPPRFVAITNEPEAIHFSYERYIANALRERFGFEGAPIRISFRGKPRKEKPT